jgi:succinate dehydrogenase hydrophobic anchor subunit
MDESGQRTAVEMYLLGMLERSDRLSQTVQARGWGFILTWAHRVAGISLVLFVLFHVYTLLGLREPAKFTSKMAFFHNFLFSFLEWALAIPVIFHALNGTRLILYEAFRVRQNAVMIRWVFMLGAAYVLTLALFMAMGDQQVSAGFFWLTIALAGAASVTIVYQRLWKTQNSTLWKLQRISGAMLLPLVSGHMFFMHLNYRMGHDAETILGRMSAPGMKVLDVALVATVFFHASFGICTIIGDNVENRLMRRGLTFLVSFVMAVFAYSGAKLVLTA